MLDRIVEEKLADAPRASSACSRPTPSATTSRSTPTRSARRSSPRCTSCASRPSTARACRTARWPTSSRPRRPGCATTSARSRSPPGWAARTGSCEFKEAQRRLQRDPARVAGRPAGRGLRRADARAGAHRVLGLRGRRGPRHRVADQGAVPAASGRRRATPPAPSTPRSRRSGSCSTSRPTPASSSPRAWRCGRARRSAACTSPTRSRSTSWSAGIGRDQVEDYAAPQGLDVRRGREVALAEPRLRGRGLIADGSGAPRVTGGAPPR